MRKLKSLANGGQELLTAKRNLEMVALAAEAWPVSVLLVGAAPDRAASVMSFITEHVGGPCRFKQVDTLACAREFLARRAADLALFNPALLESADEDGEKEWSAAPDTLVLPLGRAQPAGSDWLSAILRYVVRRKSTDCRLRFETEVFFQEKERSRVALQLIGDGVLMTDTRGSVTSLNKVAESMTGWSSDEAWGRPLSDVFHIVDGLTGEATANPAAAAMAEDQIIGPLANCVLFRRDGHSVGVENSAAPVHDRNGKVTGAVIVFRDFSQSLAEARKMARLARHDALTGLPNRTLLTERLGTVIRLARRHQRQFALLFLDLDHFKAINDTLGHAVGDQALCVIAHRLSACVRKTDTVCRFGGDEFLVLLPDIVSPDDASRIAEKMLASLAMPLRLSGHTLQVTASVGVSIHPQHGTDAETMIRHADTAMYYAKANGRDGYGFFQPEVNRRRTAVGRPSNAHRSPGLRPAGLQLSYQAHFDLPSGCIVGAEVLLRRADQTSAVSSQDKPLAAAGQVDLSASTGLWILTEICRQSLAWSASGLKPLPLWMNVSASEFRHPGFPEIVREALRATGVKPASIVLAVPEAALAQNAAAAAATLRALNDIGVQLAINQFGIGNLGLLDLKRFPINALKIDPSCLQYLRATANAVVTMNQLLILGKCLSYPVLACGVETAEQLAFLQAHACDAAQGPYLHHPLCAEDFALLLASRQTHASNRKVVR